MTDPQVLRARPIVWRVIESEFPHLVGRFSIDELISEGMAALTRAGRLWDPSRGVAFTTYGWAAIRNSIRSLATRKGRDRTEAMTSKHEPPGCMIPIEDWAAAFEQEARAELARSGHCHKSIDMLFDRERGEGATSIGRRHSITRQAVDQRLQRIGPVDWRELAASFLAGRVPEAGLA